MESLFFSELVWRSPATLGKRVPIDLSKKIEDGAAGKSLNNAVKFLDEISEFEKI